MMGRRIMGHYKLESFSIEGIDPQRHSELIHTWLNVEEYMVPLSLKMDLNSLLEHKPFTICVNDGRIFLDVIFKPYVQTAILEWMEKMFTEPIPCEVN